MPQIPGLSDLVRIGRGGFSVVYRGRQPTLARDVAVKVLLTDLTAEDDVRRFTTECQILGRLGAHRHVVEVYDAAVSAEGQPYIVMRYYRHGTLADRVAREGALPPAEVAAIGVKLAGALAAAHDIGVVHRDIKPENVLVDDDGEPILTDFGVATIADASGAYTSSIAFSRAHVAPEVLEDNAFGPASDVYSLGSTLYTLLCGRNAFVSSSEAGQVRAIMESSPPAIGRPDVPPALEAAIMQALAKDPAARFGSAAAFARALQSATGADRTQLRPVAAPNPPPPTAPTLVVAAPAAAPTQRAAPSTTPPPPWVAQPQSTSHRGLGVLIGVAVALLLLIVALALVLVSRNGATAAPAAGAVGQGDVTPSAARGSSNPPSSGTRGTTAPSTAQIPRSAVRADSGSCPTGMGTADDGTPVSYTPDKLIDGKYNTGWRCILKVPGSQEWDPSTGRAVGESVRFTFTRPYDITAVGLIPGATVYDSEGSRWRENGIVTQVQWSFDTGESFVQNVEVPLFSTSIASKADIAALGWDYWMSDFQLPRPVRTSSVTMKILAIQEGAQLPQYAAEPYTLSNTAKPSEVRFWATSG